MSVSGGEMSPKHHTAASRGDERKVKVGNERGGNRRLKHQGRLTEQRDVSRDGEGGTEDSLGLACVDA